MTVSINKILKKLANNIAKYEVSITDYTFPYKGYYINFTYKDRVHCIYIKDHLKSVEFAVNNIGTTLISEYSELESYELLTNAHNLWQQCQNYTTDRLAEVASSIPDTDFE